MELVAAAPEEWRLACRLALGHAPPGDHEKRAAGLLALIEKGEFDPAGLILAHRAGVPIGAIAAQVLPGGTGVVLPPFGPDTETCDALVVAAVEYFRRSEVTVAHCALAPEDSPLAAPLLSGGFRFVTQLQHMIRQATALPEFAIRSASELTFVPYTDALESTFADTLVRTYFGSLDLPETTVDRPARQLLDGYRHGQPSPPHWWLVEGRSGRPVGVVMLSEIAAPKVWEIAYVGLVPEARGGGLGRQLIQHAILEADRAGSSELGLSVDLRNWPACRLYRDHLFRIYGLEDLYLVRPWAKN